MPLANYSATRDPAKPGHVTLHATGHNITTGYNPHFAPDPIMIEPPQFFFDNPAPGGIQGQIVTPFNVSKSFPFPDGFESVVINDTTGSYPTKIS